MDMTESLIIIASDELEYHHTIPNTKIVTPDQCMTSQLHTVSAIDHPLSEQSDTDTMILSSSPVIYPASSPPLAMPQKQKRKLFQTMHSRDRSPKKARIFGGFEIDEDEDDEEERPSEQSCQTASASQKQESEANKRAPVTEPNVEMGTQENSQPTIAARTVKSISGHVYPPLHSRLVSKTVEMKTCAGNTIKIPFRTRTIQQTYAETIAQRSATQAGRAKTAYYGVDIHHLMDEAKIQKELDDLAVEAAKENQPVLTVEHQAIPMQEPGKKGHIHQMWTEKYRAKKFTELVGDERTHRSVLRWLKGWDTTVFPGNTRTKPKRIYEDRDQDSDRQHRKILLLTGPPGLGKTTLAHVCAKQAGYEVLEINASDDRSRDVVKGRIKDALGTETVRGIQESGKARKSGRPVCVIVDEVDGVVTGSGGGGEGGFMKALIDLVQLDQKNSCGQPQEKTKKKGDKFRLMRPLILICNDVYAPSLRPLRNSSLAEIIHVRKPSIEKVVARLKAVFEKESITCDGDAVRRLCESSWGLGSRKQNSLSSRGAGEGDIRGILVQGEWAAHKLRASSENQLRLTRKWVEDHLGESGANQKGLGRGGIREVVERVFIEGAGLPNLPTKLSDDEARLVADSKAAPIGVADLRKRAAISALREMINTCGEHDRLMTECFATYPTQVYQDDTLLSKPNASYEWLHFHDSLSNRIHSGQEWELGGYLNTSACGFHSLFAALDKGARGWENEKSQAEETGDDVHPFAGLKADFAAHEAQKQHRAVLTEVQSKFSAPMLRLFSSVDAIATELVPNVAKILAPEVKPVVVGGSGGSASVASVRKESERNCIKNAVRVMHGLSIDFEKVRIEHEGLGAHSNGGYVFRMDPPIDTLTMFHLTKSSSGGPSTSISSTKPLPPSTAPAPVRYAIRQVLAQELYKEKQLQASIARQARMSGSSLDTPTDVDQEYHDPGSNKEDEINTTSKPMSTVEKLKSGNYNMIPSKVAAPPPTATVKKDFFGRPILQPSQPRVSKPSVEGVATKNEERRKQNQVSPQNDETNSSQRIWVSFHEGYSTAVRKYISLKELMDGF